MPTALIIDKKGSIKEIVLKIFAESDLYKKAGFKSADGFKHAQTWTIDAANKTYNISLYGKTDGRAGQENKYDFPPPVDNTLFFGSCVLVNNLSEDKNTIDSVSKDEWKVLYDHLFGGFEDLGSEDSEESDDEDDEDNGLERTKEGYAKDGFIVEDGVEDGIDDDDADEDDEDDDEEESDISEEEVRPTKKRKITPPKKKIEKKIPKEKKKSTVFDRIVQEPLVINDAFMDCTSELEEEEYI
jgi:hypothetical protein